MSGPHPERFSWFERNTRRERLAPHFENTPRLEVERGDERFSSFASLVTSPDRTYGSGSFIHAPAPVPKAQWFGSIWRGALTLFTKLVAYRGERHQETHTWNWEKPSPDVYTGIDPAQCVTVGGTYEGKFFPGLWMHFGKFGGWRDYVVLEVPPEHAGDWRVGCVGAGMSRIPLSEGRVRMLLGPVGTSATFFAVDPTGHQIPLRIAGRGRLGETEDTARYGTVPLL